MSYDVLDVRPVTKRIGAEVFGVDLNAPLGNKVVSELHDALMEHQVLFFRDQHLEHDNHKRLGRYFGELAMHSGVSGLADHPEIVAIHADANSKFIAGEDWHSDLSEDAEPPMGSILYMHTVPPTGGDTLWSSMYAAYDALSPAMQDFLEPLTAVHDSNHIYRELFPDVDKVYPRNTHPVVRTHPVTKRKCLFISKSKTIKINGLSEEEGDAVLRFLTEHVKNPNFQVRFRWQPHSVAFWDNRCTQHFATWDYFPETRSGYRVTIAGDRPY
ncbi:MAG: TauD/TfdA family dioxygenase [Alphaproteobacteria bacterium]|nr:TauD/TfdA family dioxygenase [Alphaproteobacteria bacterium]MBU0793408.1 TauD/TfdA family dioxygenase [Alphaproteobacteria bacterium]MBU0877001.1 TauD/TfdA family dioxygenase [Alphaproteobacteria bacterium]MBU1768427.1 TauD/TfdA family dioxygenase [Alphaproteobacteria bacterium]